jgi:hypothetical protein
MVGAYGSRDHGTYCFLSASLETWYRSERAKAFDRNAFALQQITVERYRRKEFPIERLIGALGRRIADLPHSFFWLLSAEAKKQREQLRNMHNVHSGERCVIIANGPSLVKTNMRKLRTERTFGMNRIYLNFTEMGFEPTFYVAINELVVKQFNKDIAQLKMPKFINWNQRKLFPLKLSDINYLKINLGLFDSFCTDLSKPISSGGTVTFVALQVAYFMGFNEVVLVGLDHRYTEVGTPNKAETRHKSIDESHFHPNYFPKGSKWQLPDLYRSELAYAKARKAFEADGRRIFDATIGGACQVFEKAEFSKLF